MPKKEAMTAIPGLDPASEQKKPTVDYIEEMVGALTDPIIVFPAGGWEEDIKNFPLYKELPEHRLIHQMLCLQGMADINECTNLEAMLYMYPVTMQKPIGAMWTRIYLYLGTQVMKEMPEDIKQTELSDYDMRELQQLKRWIRKKVIEARKLRRRQEMPKEVEVQVESCEQLKLNF